MRWTTLWLLTPIGCGARVDSDREAALATLGLEGALERALELGMDGFRAASSANLPTQTGVGDVSGTMTVDGQADQGNSANKNLRLDVALAGYADLEALDDGEGDALAVTYATPDGAPLAVDLQLRGIPDGTLEGTFSGDVLLAGDLEGQATLALTVAGALVPDGDEVAREDGTTAITGTVTNDGGGTFDVDLTL